MPKHWPEFVLQSMLNVDFEGMRTRRMRRYAASRRELFERLDRPALKPLPATRFVSAESKTSKKGLCPGYPPSFFSPFHHILIACLSVGTTL